MACRLGIIPAVFNGKSLPLDHGDEKRYFTKAQRQAMENRDGGCTKACCSAPSTTPGSTNKGGRSDSTPTTATPSSVEHPTTSGNATTAGDPELSEGELCRHLIR